jgi:hypothetical protein
MQPNAKVIQIDPSAFKKQVSLTEVLTEILDLRYQRIRAKESAFPVLNSADIERYLDSV